MARFLPFLLPALPRAARLAQLASLAAGLSYPLLDPQLPAPLGVAAKGAGVALLAVAALLLPAPGARWLAAIMAAGALGDVLLELPGGFLAGALAFATGHVVAMAFYGRNRRAAGPSERLLAAGLVFYGLAMPRLVTPADLPVGMLMIYSVLLCGMAAALLLSRFPRLALAGALLFIFSDTLLIMRLGGRVLFGPDVHGAAVWLSYYLGQAMIFAGVARDLVRSPVQ